MCGHNKFVCASLHSLGNRILWTRFINISYVQLLTISKWHCCCRHTRLLNYKNGCTYVFKKCLIVYKQWVVTYIHVLLLVRINPISFHVLAAMLCMLSCCYDMYTEPHAIYFRPMVQPVLSPALIISVAKLRWSSCNDRTLYRISVT